MIRNLAAHISGRKHSGKISNKEWILVDSQDRGEEEQDESLQLPEPVAAVEVFFKSRMFSTNSAWSLKSQQIQDIVKSRQLTLPQVESSPRLITAASPDSPLTRELDRHQSVSCQSGGSLIGLEYLVEIREVGQTIIANVKAFIGRYLLR